MVARMGRAGSRHSVNSDSELVNMHQANRAERLKTRLSLIRPALNCKPWLGGRIINQSWTLDPKVSAEMDYLGVMNTIA